MKPYMTESQLIDELVNNKHIMRQTIPEGIFTERAYTTIVNPYKKFICSNFSPITGNYIYKENGDFNDYLIMAQYDDYISSKLFIYINHFEKKLKSYIAEVIASKMVNTSIYCNDYNEFANLKRRFPTKENLYDRCTDPISPCHYSCYDLLCIDEMYDDELLIITADKNIIRNRKRAIDFLCSICNTSRSSTNLLVQHNYNTGVIPPIWIAIHTLSLGDILAIYNMLNKNDRINFCKDVLNKERVRNKSIAGVSAKIDAIRQIRNTINHFEPLVPYLLYSYDSHKTNEIYTLFEFLKDNYSRSKQQNLRLSRKKILGQVEKNNFNKKRLEFIDKILKIL